ncbi:MAG: NeuD/PglB/VioB family sugar acetyltransferase [Bacteroidales bacterium]|nr:NeuD/PglB/VioB family sugar acetyltransferase [Bacteroidales bacterium]
MKDIIIIGAGALGEEIAWLIEEINDYRKEWNLLGFLDDYAFDKKDTVLGYKVLGKSTDIDAYPDAYFTIAYGSPNLRRKTVENINKESINWATLISPTVRVHHSNKIGKGVIIGRYTDLTINCEIDDFVMLNIHVVLGHKVKVGKYSIISPNVTVNGEGIIGEACQVGANSFIKNIVLGDNVTVGASSCVVKDVESDHVVVGVPAKIIKSGRPNKSISRDDQ